jgi:uncharacterized protein (TIGR01777 family)
MEKIAVTGGSGLVGSALIPVLQQAGHEAFAWRRPYDPAMLEGVTVIINLAGENLSAGRWSQQRKARILNSRVETLESIFRMIEGKPNTIHTLISSSASGYYGSVTSQKVYREEDPAGSDFLADVCRLWENAADSFSALGIRVLKLRTGVVFSQHGGALPKLMMPLKFGISAPLGSGNQWLPWIHIDDLARMILHLMEHKVLSGPFNAAAPNPVTNRQLAKHLATEHRKLYLPFGPPAFLLRILLGEMSTVVLEGSRLSAEKILAAGFTFLHQEIGTRDA